MSQANDVPPDAPPTVTDTDTDTDEQTDTQADTASSPSADTPPTDPAPEADDDIPLPLNQVFDVLKNQRRRRVLRMLQATDGQRSLSELAEQIAAWENDKPVKQITSSERKRVYVGLYQCHLPKMDRIGVIDFNKPRGTVELGDNMEVMYRYLDTVDEPDEPDWHRYSLALSAFGSVGLGVALLTRPMTTFPVVELIVLGLLVAFAAYGFLCLNWTRLRDDDGNDDVPADATTTDADAAD